MKYVLMLWGPVLAITAGIVLPLLVLGWLFGNVGVIAGAAVFVVAFFAWLTWTFVQVMRETE